MRRYKVAYIYKAPDGQVSKLIGDVELNAMDDDDAKRLAIEMATTRQLPGANAVTLLYGMKPIFQGFLDTTNALAKRRKS